MAEDPGIPLVDLIDAVRAQLESSVAKADPNRLQFEVQDLELDVEVTTTGTKEASGGIKLWVVNLGGKGSRSTASTHRVKVRLTAALGGQRLKVRDDRRPRPPASSG